MGRKNTSVDPLSDSVKSVASADVFYPWYQKPGTRLARKEKGRRIRKTNRKGNTHTYTKTNTQRRGKKKGMWMEIHKANLTIILHVDQDEFNYFFPPHSAFLPVSAFCTEKPQCICKELLKSWGDLCRASHREKRASYWFYAGMHLGFCSASLYRSSLVVHS